MEWNQLNREDKIAQIKYQLVLEMDSPAVDTCTIRNFLQFLAEHTRDGCRHVFITTNWDYLLQRELDKYEGELNEKSVFTRIGGVFHLNGTVEPRQ